MSDQNLVNRRDFVKTAGGAVAAHVVAGRRRVRAGARGPQALRDHRHRRARHRHVGPPDSRALLRRRSVRRPLRHQPEARRKFKGPDRRRLSDVYELRRDARQGEARPRHGDDARRVPQPVHRQGPRPWHRRDDREADGHRREAMPGRARRREAQQEEDHRDLQLPIRAQAPRREGNSHVGRDRQGAVGRLRVVSRRVSRRRLLPALARIQERRRQSVGAQGHPSFRSGQLVARRRSRRSRRQRPVAGVRQERHDPRHQLPRLPAQEGVPLLLRPEHEPDPHEAVRRPRRMPTATIATAVCTATTSTSTIRCRRS